LGTSPRERRWLEVLGVEEGILGVTFESSERAVEAAGAPHPEETGNQDPSLRPLFPDLYSL